MRNAYVEGLKGIDYPVVVGMAYQSIEESVDPHAGLDDKIDKARMSDPQIQEALSKRVRITQADLKKYGYSEGCPRCNDLSRGAPQDEQVLQ